MSISFPYTCPTIDRHIMSAKCIIRDHTDDIVNDLNPMFYSANSGKDKDDYVESNMDSLYDSLEHEFEEVRKLNDELRSSCNEQIEELEDKVSALETERDVFESENDQLRDENNDLEARIRELEEQFSKSIVA